MNKQQLSKLQALWYKKLEKSGFEDIEKPNGELKAPASDMGQLRRLKSLKPEAVANYRATGNAAKYDYYFMCSEFLLHYRFKSAREKRIFSLHAEGLSGVSICGTVRKAKNGARRTISRLIKRLADEMMKGSWRPVVLEDEE